jgi:hypothetical protein
VQGAHPASRRPARSARPPSGTGQAIWHRRRPGAGLPEWQVPAKMSRAIWSRVSRCRKWSRVQLERLRDAWVVSAAGPVLDEAQVDDSAALGQGQLAP